MIDMMTGKTIRWSAVHGPVLAIAVAALTCGQTARAGVITVFTERTSWEAAALAAGLTVTIEDFAVEPAGFPSFTVGGIDWTSDGPYSAANQRAGYDMGGGVTMKIDFTGGAAPLFGFGMDLGPNLLGVARATDIDGDFVNNGSSNDGFVGLLGTARFDPANPLSPIDPNDDGATEFGTSGLASIVWVDNLSVATGPFQIDEPAAVVIFSLGLAGLVCLRRRREARYGVRVARSHLRTDVSSTNDIFVNPT